MPIRGIGKYQALLNLAEIGDIAHFPGPTQLAVFAGLCPSTFQSEKAWYHGRITKQGSDQKHPPKRVSTERPPTPRLVSGNSRHCHHLARGTATPPRAPQHEFPLSPCRSLAARRTIPPESHEPDE